MKKGRKIAKRGSQPEYLPPAISPFSMAIDPQTGGPANSRTDTAGNLDVFVIPSDTGLPIKLRTRGGSGAWVDLSVDQALDVARELILKAQEIMRRA